MAAVREVKEETGVSHHFLYMYYVNTFNFDAILINGLMKIAGFTSPD